MEYHIIGIRENHEYLDRAIEYFSNHWDIDRRIYRNCITYSICTDSSLPRWYLMLHHENIIGGYGIITNDFISRQDLYPWICALYVNEEYRGQHLGEKLLEHARTEVSNLGFPKVYLCTDHIGYYEKYGWTYIGDGFHPWGETSRIYEHDSIPG